MGMKSLFSPPSAAGEDFVLLTEEPLDAVRAIATVESAARGAIVTFEGRVRGTEKGESIAALHYDAYLSMARPEMEKIIREAGSTWAVKSVLHHRLGRVPVNAAALLVVVGGGHRAEAFEACRWIVDQVKIRAAIWKASAEKAFTAEVLP